MTDAEKLAQELRSNFDLTPRCELNLVKIIEKYELFEGMKGFILKELMNEIIQVIEFIPELYEIDVKKK